MSRENSFEIAYGGRFVSTVFFQKQVGEDVQSVPLFDIKRLEVGERKEWVMRRLLRVSLPSRMRRNVSMRLNQHSLLSRSIKHFVSL